MVSEVLSKIQNLKIGEGMKISKQQSTKKIINKKFTELIRRKNKYPCRQDITDKKTHEIAERFLSYQKKTAENIIEMSRVVIEAKNRSEMEFEDFCLLIGYSSVSSTIRKLESIGQKYEYLISRSDRLPPAWTVIYEISKLDEEQIEGYIQSNRITSRTSGSEVNKLLGSHKPKVLSSRSSRSTKSTLSVPNGTTEQLKFTASLIKMSDEKALLQLDNIFHALSDLGFELDISDRLRSEISEYKTYEMIIEGQD